MFPVYPYIERKFSNYIIYKCLKDIVLIGLFIFNFVVYVITYMVRHFE